MSVAARTSSKRRADIDYLRVGALLILIVYHVLLVYDSWEWWRVKSEHAGTWADYLMTMVTPWRMTLVFFVGGVAARFMIERSTTAAFIKDRAAKLLTAFLFAVIVLMPLQRYVRLEEMGLPVVSYFEYLLHGARYATQVHGIWLPDFAHAWFLPYLFAYSVGVVLFYQWAPRTFAALQDAVLHAPIWGVVGAVMLWFTFREVILLRFLPETRVFVTDLAAHLRFVPVFLLGVLIGKSDVFFARLQAIKAPLWALTGLLLIASLGLQATFIATHHQFDVSDTPYFVTHGLFGGAALFAITAFAGWAFNRPSAGLTYASDAILPVYLLHQTVLVVAADAIVARHWPLASEFSILLAASFLIPLAIYHLVVRHTTWLRVLFGLRPHVRETTMKPQPPQSVGDERPVASP